MIVCAEMDEQRVTESNHASVGWFYAYDRIRGRLVVVRTQTYSERTWPHTSRVAVPSSPLSSVFEKSYGMTMAGRQRV